MRTHSPTDITGHHHAARTPIMNSTHSPKISSRHPALAGTRQGVRPTQIVERGSKATLKRDRRSPPPIFLTIRVAITLALGNSEAARIQDLPGPRLKELTGLPPTKAVRALCVWFGIVEGPTSQWPVTSLRSEEIEAFAHSHFNPFDLLLDVDVASLLDLGAGDLSLATELSSIRGPPSTATARVDSS